MPHLVQCANPNCDAMFYFEKTRLYCSRECAAECVVMKKLRREDELAPRIRALWDRNVPMRQIERITGANKFAIRDIAERFNFPPREYTRQWRLVG